MNAELMLLTKELHEIFKPYIMTDIWQHINDPDIFGYGITKDNLAIGAIVCSYNDGTVNLLSLGVSSDHYRRGYARQLLKHLQQVCASQNFYEINAKYFLDEERRIPLEALLASCDYSFMDGEFKMVTVTLGALKGSRAEQQFQKAQASQLIKKMVPYGELSLAQQQWLLEQVKIQWNDRSQLSPSRSCVSLQNEQIVGAALISEKAGTLEVVQLYSSSGNDVASMLCLFATMGEAYTTLSPDTIVRFHAVDDIADSLTSKLLDGCEIHTIQERLAYRSVPSRAVM